jgi:hypothetical protein
LQALAELQEPSGNYPHDPYNPGVYLQWNINPTDWDALLKVSSTAAATLCFCVSGED